MSPATAHAVEIAMQRDDATMAELPFAMPAASAASAASTEAATFATASSHSPQLPTPWRPPSSDAFDVEPHWLARRAAMQNVLATFGSPPPESGFSAMLRSPSAPINLPPRVDLNIAPPSPGEPPHTPVQRSPASSQRFRRGRVLAFDESQIPAGLRPPRLIRDSMRYAPMALEEIVASWCPTGNSDALTTLQERWRIISTEDGARTFGKFLAKLNKNINTDNLSFRRQTAELLDQLSKDDALRQQVFAISVESTTSCEDRVSHTMVLMQTAARAASFKQTDFATDAQALQVQRQFHRLALLHDIARTIVDETGNGDEELETHLHLLIRHVDALELNGSVPAMDMRFDICSRISEPRSATVPAEIKRQENEQFAGWLAHSPSWLDYIARTDQTRFDTAQKARDTLFETGFQERLDARLADAGLHKADEPAVWDDAELLLGKAVFKEMIDEINSRLTKDFLAARDALHLLEKYWPDDACAVANLPTDIAPA